MARSKPVAIEPLDLLILEERLKERQVEDGWPPADADLTQVALTLLVAAEVHGGRLRSDAGGPWDAPEDGGRPD